MKSRRPQKILFTFKKKKFPNKERSKTTRIKSKMIINSVTVPNLLIAALY